MTLDIRTNNGPAGGLDIHSVPIRATNRAGGAFVAAQGICIKLDLAGSATEVTAGDVTLKRNADLEQVSTRNNFVAPSAGATGELCALVYQDLDGNTSIADNEEGTVIVSGIATGLSGEALAIGDQVTPNAAGRLVGLANPGDASVGVALTSTSGTGQTFTVLFNGTAPLFNSTL